MQTILRQTLALNKRMLEAFPVPIPLHNNIHVLEVGFKERIEGYKELRDMLGNKLQVAAVRGDADLLQRLLGAGANINNRSERGRTALHNAVHYGQAESVDVLCTNGANVDAVDNHGLTPLHIACTGGEDAIVSEPVVRRLLRAGANEAAMCGGGLTPGHYLDRCGHRRRVRIRRLLQQAAERRVQRRHCVWITILRNRAGKAAAVRPVQRRRSTRLQDERAMKAAEAMKTAVFLVHDAPGGVFCEVMGFLGMLVPMA